MVLENCPKCQEKLSTSFSSSNRQVCSSCGWSERLIDTRRPNLYNEKHPASTRARFDPIDYIYEKLNSADKPQNSSSKTKSKKPGVKLIWSNIFVILMSFCLSLIQIPNPQMTLGYLTGVLLAKIYTPSLAVAISQLIKPFRNSRARWTIFLLFSLKTLIFQILALIN